ncbi:nucleotidyltransferase family protein [Kriegella aquimaris]|uniref:Nucleotidyl transferase n=1 Tax=Kriegella aquimaris TaxID=192904 RepID=A0A1G9QHB8_9FLAO|nr:nucleotidyltransferase family protein [Kriegella aquimaris]SDM10366.1 Nucleotidyl transferase [Kriegella aquimaris]
MRNFRDHLILTGSSIKDALFKLNELAKDAILFVADPEGKLVGSLTDGDVRRGLLRGIMIDNVIEDIIQKNPRYIRKEEGDIQKIIEYREGNFRILPVVDKNHKIVNVINFREMRSYLPIDAVIMAGGRGERLRPLTDSTPKPLLKIGDKPIIEHNIDRLVAFGVDDFWISVRYLGEQIEAYFKDGSEKNIKTKYLYETKPLGTIGAIANEKEFLHDYILVTNSDILTNLNYEDFFLSFVESEADLSVVTIPYEVNVPYAVLETTNKHVVSFKEKPTYTYYSNGGIYLMKKKILELIPQNEFFNATDLMEKLIGEGYKVHSYPLRGYWLDIGKHEDFERAQEDIKHIKF